MKNLKEFSDNYLTISSYSMKNLAEMAVGPETQLMEHHNYREQIIVSHIFGDGEQAKELANQKIHHKKP